MVAQDQIHFISDHDLLGWYFLSEDYRHDYLPYAVVVPQTKFYDDPPLQPGRGVLRACRRVIDALLWGPPTTLICRVKLSGKILEESATGLAWASEWTALWMADATRVLDEFSTHCARIFLNAERAVGREIHPCLERAVEVRERWLNGQATDDEWHETKAKTSIEIWEKDATSSFSYDNPIANWIIANNAAEAVLAIVEDLATNEAELNALNSELECRLLMLQPK